MEILLGWYETQKQNVLVSHVSDDGCDCYSSWEIKEIQTSPYGYLRTNKFASKEDAEKWCEANSTECSHYFLWETPFEDYDKIVKKYEPEKWYYD